MRWNWQDPDWPIFRFRQVLLADREGQFLRQSGVVVGTVRHVPDEERLLLVIDLISTEALKTSEIEGEMLDRDSVQSSLRRQFGLQADTRHVAPAELGIAETLADLYRRYATHWTTPRCFNGTSGCCKDAPICEPSVNTGSTPNRCKWCRDGWMRRRFTSKRRRLKLSQPK